MKFSQNLECCEGKVWINFSLIAKNSNYYVSKNQVMDRRRSALVVELTTRNGEILGSNPCQFQVVSLNKMH